MTFLCARVRGLWYTLYAQATRRLKERKTEFYYLVLICVVFEWLKKFKKSVKEKNMKALYKSTFLAGLHNANRNK